MHTFDPEKLEYKKFSRKNLVPVAFGIALVSFICGLMSFQVAKTEKDELAYDELIVMVDEKENDLISPQAVYDYMKELHIKFPEIVWSQVALETGFNSDIFLENHNLFGMKEAASRPNIQSGKERGHAVYSTWKESVADYAMWQSSTGVWKLKNEDAYFNYLGQKYAEDPQYVFKVKAIRMNFEAQLKAYQKKFTGT